MEYRDEKFSQDYDAQQNAGNVDGSAGGADVNGARTVLALYAETSLPITEDIELVLAGRFDSYNDFGTTVNPKVSIGYRPMDTLLIRTSYGEGFRAPSMSQLYSTRADVNGARTVLALYAETSLPITEDIELVLAGRFDSYNDFGTTVNPKVSIGYRPMDTLLIRTSYGEGFRAPSMSQLYSSPAQSFDGAIDAVGCAASPQGGPDGRPLPGVTLPQGHICLLTQYQNFTGGNTGLDAELSEGFNFGVVFNPIDDLSISLDYYHIDLVDQISPPTLQSILDAELLNMGSPLVTRSGGGQIVAIQALNGNISGTKTTGLDLDLRYSFSAGGAGDFTTQLNWSHVSNFVQDLDDGTGFNSTTFSPDDRIQWNVNWSLSDYSATLIGNYINSTPVAGGGTLDDWTTWDLQLNWATPWNGRLTVGARNLFDKDPPQSPQVPHPFYSNQLHDIYGRVPYIRYTQDL